MSDQDLQNAGASLREKADQKKDGYDDTHEHADSYKAGHRRAMSNQSSKNNDSSKDVRDKVNKEYKDLGPEAREAYKKGYSSGSAKR